MARDTARDTAQGQTHTPGPDANTRWMADAYQVDSEAELIERLDMIAHNYRCQTNILANPTKFPKANVAYLERSTTEHHLFLAGRLHPAAFVSKATGGSAAS